MKSNYFVCTLGEAAALSRDPKPYQTIGEFISHQAQNKPHLPAVAFPIPRADHESWGHSILDFEAVYRATHAVASRLLDCCGPTLEQPQTIALLAHSSPDFLLTWLALVALGHSVLLIAPQCQPAAIVHLCKTCQVSLLLHDDSHNTLAQKAKDVAKKDDSCELSVSILPFEASKDLDQMLREERDVETLSSSDASSIAYLHHTSGTSSGLPKPIAQSHRAAIGVLPHLVETPSKATFTTTPLYHGGIADLFRAWTSDSLIWLFPGKDVPITARNICQCLDVAASCTVSKGTAAVRYFSSVPYVLQMVEADTRGLELLCSMEVVGVGGAALPAEVGDRLVGAGVNLISRFGSAECGFLLSSYRDFEVPDKEWQYLRDASPAGLLAFENRDDGLSELVIKPGWSHMAKTNRPDGSFATADLFAPHASIANAWLYHSRADSQLTLITGKKFDPAPLEAAIATSPHLDDVLIFGNHRPFAGALLLRSQSSASIADHELLKLLRPSIEKLNQGSQAHARIPYDMLVPLQYQERGLEKSSKGTIIRKAAEERFQEQIKQAYARLDLIDQVSVADKDLLEYITDLIQSIVSTGTSLGPDTELFSYGMDSVASMQLRNRLRSLTPHKDTELPLSIVEDCGTAQALSQYILDKRHGSSATEDRNEEQAMHDLVERYSDFNQSQLNNASFLRNSTNTARSPEIVLLTGATGALGAHVLHLLRQSEDTSRIYCLVRGADEHASQERVIKALEQRGLGSLVPDDEKEKATVLQARFGESDLGLSAEMYDKLVNEVTCIIHVAWTVNFRINLRSFEKDNIAGVKNLIDIAIKSQHDRPPRFIYCSSTAAVMNSRPDKSEPIPEQITSDPNQASPLGYSRSKWVAEQICWNAHCQTALKDRIAVVRIGQLAGDSNSGIWNTQEAWPMMLSTLSLTQSLPNLPNEPLDWLPVDIAARALIETAVQMEERKGMHVYHVLNEHQQPTWFDMLGWLKAKEKFEIVSPEDWVGRLAQQEGSGHPALKLLGLWKEAYCGGTKETSGRPSFSLATTKQHIPVLNNVKPLDEAYILKIWAWVRENVR